MRCNWRRWLWGVIPLVGLGVTAAQVERPAIEKDLTERAERALAAKGHTWAVVTFSGRDVLLTGNATIESEPVEAEAELRHLWGVRHVSSNAGLPPKIAPFTWSARRRGSRVRLVGYVPSKEMRQTVIGMTTAAVPGLEVVDHMHMGRGVPPSDTWLAGLSFGLKQLSYLKRGDVSLADLSMTISGEAEDAASYREISAALKRGLPKGITLAKVDIVAPVVSPYTWSMQFAGGQLVLSGHVANESARADLLAAAKAAGLTDSVDRMEPAAGAPAGWAKAAVALVKQLVQLQSGNAEIKDTAVVVGGLAADEVQAQAVRKALHAALPPAFKLTDQIRVREPPKVENAPPAPAAGEQKAAAPAPAGQPTAAPAPAEQKAPAPVEKQVSAPAGQQASGPTERPAPLQEKAPAGAEQTTPAPAAQPQAAAPAEKPAPVEPKAPAPTDQPAPPPAAQAKEAPPAAPAPPSAAEPKVAAAPEAAPQAPAPAMPPASEAAPKTALAPPAPPTPAACRDDVSKVAKASPILFERGSAEIKGASLEALQRIVAALKACPGLHIAAQGHTDIEGSADYNRRLSIKRAKVVAEYLIEAGLGADQVESIGFGTSYPAVPNTSPTARAKNRRTEIVVRP
jgi:outer membrane protein OmpA-like peptidoglycan-associated protein